MKLFAKIFGVIISLAMSCLITGCYDSVPLENWKPSLKNHYLAVFPQEFQFENGEDTRIGTITTEQSWSFSDVPDWLTVSPMKGESDAEFSITSKSNSLLVNREAILFVNGDPAGLGIQKTITVSQICSEPYIKFPEYDSSNIEIDGKNNYLIIDVDSNVPDLSASFSQPWGKASYNTDAKTVNIEIELNETDDSRSGILIVSSKEFNKSVKLTISQLASGVSIIDGRAMDFDAEGGTQTRTVNSDIAWVAKTTYPWIDFYPKSGDAGETKINISLLPSYEADKRIGQIYFYFGETQKGYIGITQSGRFINISPEEVTLESKENSYIELLVESNIDWKVLYKPEWVNITPDKGSKGITSVKIVADDNKSLNARSSTVAFSDETEMIQATANILQKGIEFEDEATMDFGWEESQRNLNVQIPNAWSAAVSADWISLSSYEGTGNSDVMVYVARNDDETSRQGNINFISEGNVVSISVVQSGQYLFIDKVSGEVGAMGGNIDLTLSSSVPVASTVNYSDSDQTEWISLNRKSDSEFDIAVGYNSSTKSRDAVVMIMPDQDNVSEKIKQGLKFLVKQRGRTISAQVKEIAMYPKGGKSGEYIVQSDGEYSLEKDIEDYWYSLVLDKSKNTFYIVVTKNTAGVERVGNITLTLLNTPEGEENYNVCIKVRQLSSDYDININDYGEDEIIL